MGYRSQVVLAIGKELTPFLLLATSRCKQAEALVFKEHDRFDRDYYEGWLLRWDEIKWYDGYEGINAIEKFMHAACSDEYEIMKDGKKQNSSEYIRFVRVGEESTDIEMHGDGFLDIIYPHTLINY
jgi:hypothetical protein